MNALSLPRASRPRTRTSSYYYAAPLKRNAKTTTLLFNIPNLNPRLQDRTGHTKEHPRLAVAGSKTPQAATTLVQLQTKDKRASCSCTFTSNLRYPLRSTRSVRAFQASPGFGQKIYSTSSITRLVLALASRRRVAIRPVQRSPQLWGLRPPATFPGAHVRVSAQRDCRKPKLRTMESQNNVEPRTLNRCGL